MREKQQRRRSLTAFALVGCLASWLGTAVVISPASAVQEPRTAPGVMVGGQPVGIAADPTTKSFWVAAFSTGQPKDVVSRVSETGHAVKTVKVTSGVSAIAADPIRGLVWTIGNGSNGSAHTVSFIRESDNSPHAASVPATSALTGLAVDPATGKVYILDLDGDVFTINEATPAAAPTVFFASGLTSASGLAIDHGTNTIWILNSSGNAAFAFTESAGAVVGNPVDVGNNPGVIAVDPSTRTVWVGNSDSSISEFAEATPATVHEVTLGSNALAFAPDKARKLIWVGTQNGAIYGVTDTASPASAGSLALPNEVDGLALDPGSDQLWATENITSQGRFDNLIPFAASATTITSPKLTWFASNNSTQNTFSVRTGGFPLPRFSISGAPSWLTIDKQTGILTAKLTKRSKFGAFKLTITASDGVGAAAHQAFTANVGADPVLATTSATFASTGNNALQLKATGTPAPKFAGIGLPKGLTLSASGLLSGTPPKGAHSPIQFVLKISNSVTKTFNSPVESVFAVNLVKGRAVRFTSAAKVTFKHGKHASFTIKTAGFPAPSLKESGKLPKGLKLTFGKKGTATAGTAVLSGTPAASDKGHTFKVTITATNGVGKPATQPLTLKIT
ncbi:MAG TPA: putative Ig domain-containing protein [Streptosporangiaceae bacterium]|nr:putative Ig domain-containing protein [Streptosporangiaceae bacterium]